MIRRLYDGWVDRLAADRGALAFVKWFALGVVAQLILMLPALPLLAVSVLIEGEAGKVLAVTGFVAVFLAARLVLFVLPCAAVARRKGLGSPPVWGAGGLLFGPFVLAAAGALAPRAPAAGS